MKLNRLFLLPVIFLVFSCGGKQDKTYHKELKKQEVDAIDSVEPIVSIENKKSIKDSILTFSFDEFTLKINQLVLFDEIQKGDYQFDTIHVYPDYGEILEGLSFFFEKNLVENLKLEQRFQTSMTINNEGPHCDLVDWKHFESEWKQIIPNTSGIYRFITYSEKERKKFPQVSVLELKNIVKSKCGEDWFEIVKGITSFKNDITEVGINRFYLKISGVYKLTKQKVSKVLIFEIPMGC